jgi:hypothetical protein
MVGLGLDDAEKRITPATLTARHDGALTTLATRFGGWAVDTASTSAWRPDDAARSPWRPVGHVLWRAVRLRRWCAAAVRAGLREGMACPTRQAPSPSGPQSGWSSRNFYCTRVRVALRIGNIAILPRRTLCAMLSASPIIPPSPAAEQFFPDSVNRGDWTCASRLPLP